MGYSLKVQPKPAQDKLEAFDKSMLDSDTGFAIDSITSVDFITVSADAYKGKAPSATLGLIIKGNSTYTVGDLKGVEAQIKKMTKWANLYTSDVSTYRTAQVDIVAAGQVVRQYYFPQAFVAGYKEGINEETGSGYFELTLYQKGDLKAQAKIAAAFAAPDAQ